MKKVDVQNALKDSNQRILVLKKKQVMILLPAKTRTYIKANISNSEQKTNILETVSIMKLV